jgi:hypothetical protein
MSLSSVEGCSDCGSAPSSRRTFHKRPRKTCRRVAAVGRQAVPTPLTSSRALRQQALQQDSLDGGTGCTQNATRVCATPSAYEAAVTASVQCQRAVLHVPPIDTGGSAHKELCRGVVSHPPQSQRCVSLRAASHCASIRSAIAWHHITHAPCEPHQPTWSL